MRRLLPKVRTTLIVVLTVAGAAQSYGQSKSSQQEFQPSGCALDVGQFGRTPQTSPELITLESQLIDPTVPVSQQLILQLSAAASRDVSSAPGPQHEYRGGTSQANGSRDNHEDFGGKYLDILVYALPQKRDEALADSLFTVTENQFLRIRPMQSATQQCLRQTMVKVLPRLSFQDQWSILLTGDFPLFKSQALAGYLQLLYETLEDRVPEDPDFDPERELRFYRSGILKRIYEADPDKGRDMILAEVASELPRADIEALRILPDDTLPAMDAVFAKQLPLAYQNADWAEYNAKLGVVERYATSGILVDVKSVYLNDPEDRNQYHGFLFFSYFLRADPGFGRQLVEASLKIPQTNCSNVLFTELAGIRRQPELRKIAQEHLADPNKCIAQDAAYSFKYMGSKDAEPLLWRYLEEWHKEWAGKSGPIPYPEQSYEDSLTEALLFGAGPCESRDTVEKLKFLYIKGSSVDGNIEFPAWHDPIRIMVEPHHSESPSFRVDSCPASLSSEQLLLAIPDFPQGSQFEWYGPSDSTLKSLIEPLRLEIEAAIMRNAMTLRAHRQETEKKLPLH